MMGHVTKIYKSIVFIVITIVFTASLSSCQSEDVFRDYTETESYNSSMVIEDLTDTAEIITAEDGAELIDYKPTVTAGEYTSITIKLENHTEYRIEVEYSSGISKSKSLIPKVSDQNGYVTWEWQVGVKCSSGKYPVRVYRKNEIIFETRLIVE